jgi:ATP-dependent Lon protease
MNKRKSRSNLNYDLSDESSDNYDDESDYNDRPRKKVLKKVLKKDNFLVKTNNMIDLPTLLPYSKEIDEIKKYFIEKYVSLEMIVSLHIVAEKKIDLLKKFYELKEVVSCDVYIDKYIKLWNIYNESKKIADNPSLSYFNNDINYDDPTSYYINKLSNCNLDDKYKSIIYEKIMLLQSCKSDEEGFKIKEYLNFIISFPWNIYNGFIKDMKLSDLSDFILNVKSKLNNNLYGMDNVKDELLRHIINFKLGNSTNTIALCGPPGTGKTVFFKELARCLNIPFKLIQGGCIVDLSYIQGHSITYIGAVPGCIASAIKEAGCFDMIIVIDEIEKICESSNGMSIINQLIHILDQSQSSFFCDNYIGNIPIDLSRILFFCTLNDENKLNPILKNRLKIINLNGYTLDEKIIIAKKHVIPKYINSSIFKDLNLIKMDDNIIKYIIQNKIVPEDGIRSTERCFKELIDILQYLYIVKDKSINFKNKVICQTLIDKLLKNK